MAWLSILGLYRLNPDILEPLVQNVPTGIDTLQLQYDIFAECAELEILFPNVEVFKHILGAWAGGKKYKWEKLYQTMTLEYNPINNYDRKEEWNDTNTNEHSNKNTSTTTTATMGTVEQKVSAFNANTYQPDNIATNNGNGNQQAENTDTGTGKNETKRQGRAYGNIGVTTTQQMLEQERQVSNFDIYSVIVNDFKNRFCILVY